MGMQLKMNWHKSIDYSYYIWTGRGDEISKCCGPVVGAGATVVAFVGEAFVGEADGFVDGAAAFVGEFSYTMVEI